MAETLFSKRRGVEFLMLTEEVKNNSWLYLIYFCTKIFLVQKDLLSDPEHHPDEPVYFVLLSSFS